MLLRTRAALVLAALLAVPSPDRAEAPAKEDLRSRYTKYEYRIPMRDGVKLFTSVYVPKDAGAGRPYPILLTRTPYSVAPYGARRVSRGRGPVRGRRARGLHRRLPGRARAVPVGGTVRRRPALPAREGAARTSTSRRDAWDTDRLARQARALATTGASACGASRTRASTRRWPRSTRTRRSSRSRRRRPSPTGSSATTSTTTARSSCRTPSTSTRASAGRGRSRPPSGRPRLRPRHAPTATASSSRRGRCRTSTGATSRATSRSGRRSWSTRPTTRSGRRATRGRT